MREPRWRGPGDSDWGLAPFTTGEHVAETRASLRDQAVSWSQQVRAKRVERQLATRQYEGLALGSGSTPPRGWAGLDRHRTGAAVYPADIRGRLPVRSASVPCMLAEHVLEHLFLDEVPAVLADVRRVLVPGGAFRVVSPDARYIARLLLDGDRPEYEQAVGRDVAMHKWRQDRDQVIAVVNRLSHQWGQHRSLLTAQAIARMLDETGFVGIIPFEHQDKSAYFHPVPDVHPSKFPDDPPGMNFVVEARKPS